MAEAPRFFEPSFSKAKTFEAIDRIPQSFDAIFEKITQAKALERKNARADEAFELKRQEFESQEQVRQSQETRAQQAQDQKMAQLAATDPLAFMLSQRDAEERQGIVSGAMQPRDTTDPRDVEFSDHQPGELAEEDPLQTLVRERMARKKEEAIKDRPRGFEDQFLRLSMSDDPDADEKIDKLVERYRKFRSVEQQLKQKPPAKPKAPTGFRFSEDGETLEIIKGGPADLEQQALAEERRIKAKEEQERTEVRETAEKEQHLSVLSAVGQALSDIGPLSAGFAGQMLKDVGSTDAANLKSSLATLQANQAFGELTEMRQASKTGGALGQVSNIELRLLRTAQKALEQEQSVERLRENLEAVQWHYQAGLTALVFRKAQSDQERFEMLTSFGIPEEAAYRLIAHVEDQLRRFSIQKAEGEPEIKREPLPAPRTSFETEEDSGI